MSRSKWKGFFVNKTILKKFLKFKIKKEKNVIISTFSRNSSIIKEFVGVHFKVYNGIRFFNVFITEQLIGYKLGEFSYTRRLSRNIHLQKNKKKIKKKNKKKC